MGRNVKSLFLAALLAAWSGGVPADAQTGQLPPYQLWGNPTAAQAPGRATSPTGVLAPKGVFFADDYGTTHNKIADDGAALQNAINAASAAGGGTVWIGPYSYLVNTANLSVPQGVTLACSTWVSARPAAGNDYTHKPCAIYLNPTYTISLLGGIKNMFILNANIPALTGFRTAITTVDAFSGTGITIGGRDTYVDNVIIGGFATCYNSTGFPRPVVKDLLGDCTSGMIVDNAHDVGKFTNVEFWPFLTTNAAWSFPSYAVSGAADNGAGLYRLTTATNAIVNGDVLWVKGVGGAVGANGKFTASVINATTVDLVGSATAPTTTGATTTGLTYVSVASVANLAVGQTITGTNIPAGATVAAVWRNSSAISLDSGHAATGTGAAITLTFSNGAYTTGGTANLSTVYRSGTGISVTNSEGMDFVNAFSYDFNIGFDFGAGAQMTSVNNGLFDTLDADGGYGMIAVRFTGTANFGNIWKGAGGGGYETAVLANSATNNQDNEFAGAEIGSLNTTMAELSSGRLRLIGLKGNATTRILHNDTNGKLTLANISGSATSFFSNVGTPSNVYKDGATVLSGISNIGTPQFFAPISSSYRWYVNSGAADQKYWDFREDASGNLAFRSLSDNFASSTTWITINRGSGFAAGAGGIAFSVPLTGGSAANSALGIQSTSGAGTSDSITFKTGSQVQAFICDTTQHCQAGNTTAPTIASGACGTGANGAVVAGSNDHGGEITIGAVATTSCAVTFAGTWVRAPRSCMLTPSNAVAAAWGTTGAYVSGHTATTLTITGSALAGANYGYKCE